MEYIEELEKELIDNDRKCPKESMKDVFFDKVTRENKFNKVNVLKLIEVLRKELEENMNKFKYLGRNFRSQKSNFVRSPMRGSMRLCTK